MECTAAARLSSTPSRRAARACRACWELLPHRVGNSAPQHFLQPCRCTVVREPLAIYRLNQGRSPPQIMHPDWVRQRERTRLDNVFYLLRCCPAGTACVHRHTLRYLAEVRSYAAKGGADTAKSGVPTKQKSASLFGRHFRSRFPRPRPMKASQALPRLSLCAPDYQVASWPAVKGRDGIHILHLLMPASSTLFINSRLVLHQLTRNCHSLRPAGLASIVFPTLCVLGWQYCWPAASAASLFGNCWLFPKLHFDSIFMY